MRRGVGDDGIGDGQDTRFSVSVPGRLAGDGNETQAIMIRSSMFWLCGFFVVTGPCPGYRAATPQVVVREQRSRRLAEMGRAVVMLSIDTFATLVCCQRFGSASDGACPLLRTGHSSTPSAGTELLRRMNNPAFSVQRIDGNAEGGDVSGGKYGQHA